MKHSLPKDLRSAFDIDPEKICFKCFYKVRIQEKREDEEYLLGCSFTPNFTLTTTVDSTCREFKGKQ